MANARRIFLNKMTLLSLGTLIPIEAFSMSISESKKLTIPPTTMKKPKLLIFDVNETLLNMSSMEESINKAFNHEFAFSQWFAFMLQYSLVDTVTGNYHDFGTIGKAAMQMTQEKLKRKIEDAKVQELLSMIKSLPPHPEVNASLEKLQKAGYIMVTLTNSTHEVVKQQMKSAGLTNYFKELMSIEHTQKYKPHPDTYKYALDRNGTEPGEAMLIAAHGWDITGALNAGLQAAFIQREGKSLYPLSPKPQLISNTLANIADKLAAM